MTSRFPPSAFVELVSPYNKKNITRWLEDMNFMFSGQEQNSYLLATVKYPLFIDNGPVIFDWFILSMRIQVILDSLFARPGSAPIWGGKKGKFRDWTR